MTNPATILKPLSTLVAIAGLLISCTEVPAVGKASSTAALKKVRKTILEQHALDNSDQNSARMLWSFCAVHTLELHRRSQRLCNETGIMRVTGPRLDPTARIQGLQTLTSHAISQTTKARRGALSAKSRHTLQRIGNVLFGFFATAKPIGPRERERTERGYAMADLVKQVKQHARVLYREVQHGDTPAVERLRRLSDFGALGTEQIMLGAQRKYCLTVHARELGFGSFPHLKRNLSGDVSGDVGTLMHRESGGARFNIWSAHYDEAREVRDQHGGFLLGYRTQYLIVDGDFIRVVGIDPTDEDWKAIGRSWCNPNDWAAWRGLTLKCIQSRREQFLAV